MMRVLRVVVLICACSLIAFGQFTVPQGAHTDLFFPQIADGGDASQRWQTTFYFTDSGYLPGAASGRLSFFGSDGQPLQVDFGAGSASAFTFNVPAGGSVTFRTTGASGLKVGWAIATFNRPLQGNASYRVSVGTTPRQEVSVNATLPSPATLNFANAFSGVAIANPWNASLTATVSVRDRTGRSAGTRQVSLGPGQHLARVLWEWFGLPTDFTGSVAVSGTSTRYPISVVINADSQGIISSMPPGNVAGFYSDYNAIRMVFYQLVATINTLLPAVSVGSPELAILENVMINAHARNIAPNGVVSVEVGLSQLFRSMDELAFVIGHELGHISQYRRGLMFDTNPEADADIFGLLAVLIAGYDPYASGGVMGKLMMASGTSSLITQWEQDQSATDAHRSFSTRISVLNATINAVCTDPAVAQFCRDYRRQFHPNIPGLLGGIDTRGGDGGPSALFGLLRSRIMPE